MSLTNKDKQELKSRAHHLKPVIRIGNNGLSENVIAETNNALNTHELIKVHIEHDERDVRQEAAEFLATKTDALLVQKIGKIFVLYRENTENN